MHDQRIVSIQLDQTHKRTNIKIANRRVKPDILTAVLVYITVTAISLGIKFGGQRKGVVIPFQIAMFA